MKTSTIADLYTGLTVALLVILTAWGNAIAMCVVGAVGVIVGLLIFGKSFARRGALPAVIAFALAFTVAWMLQHR